jgi:AraC-like DNA-binding protein
MSHTSHSIATTSLLDVRLHRADATSGRWSDDFTVASSRMIVPLRGCFSVEQKHARLHCGAFSLLSLDNSAPYKMRRFASNQVVSLVFIPHFTPHVMPREANIKTSIQRLPIQRVLELRAFVGVDVNGAVAVDFNNPLAVEELFAAIGFDEQITSLDREKRVTDRASRAVLAAQEFLAENVARKLTLTEIGHAVHASPFHLARAFKAQVGITLHQTQLQLRIVEALNSIDDGEKNLSLLAHELGFSSHAHFTLVFRKLVGFPPGQHLKRRAFKPQALQRQALEQPTAANHH